LTSVVTSTGHHAGSSPALDGGALAGIVVAVKGAGVSEAAVSSAVVGAVSPSSALA